MLTTDAVSDGRTVVHQVQGSSASQTPTNCQTELELNSFGNVVALVSLSLDHRVSAHSNSAVGDAEVLSDLLS